MILTARFLGNLASVNNFTYEPQAAFSEGDVTDVWVQLIDKSLDTAAQGFNPSGRRYMPAVGATLQTTFDNIDAATALTKYPTQPYPTSDPSIWLVQILSTDVLPGGTYTLKLKLTEGTKVTYGRVEAGVAVVPQTAARC